jgi:hypothetical protein
MCDPEVATVNSSLELTVGSASREKRTVTRAQTVAIRSLRYDAEHLFRMFVEPNSRKGSGPENVVDRTPQVGEHLPNVRVVWRLLPIVEK